MATGKKPPKKRSRPQVERTPENAYLGVVLEEMRSQHRATIEAVLSLGQRMDRRFDELARTLDERISALEVAVR